MNADSLLVTKLKTLFGSHWFLPKCQDPTLYISCPSSESHPSCNNSSVLSCPHNLTLLKITHLLFGLFLNLSLSDVFPWLLWGCVNLVRVVEKGRCALCSVLCQRGSWCCRYLLHLWFTLITWWSWCLLLFSTIFSFIVNRYLETGTMTRSKFYFSDFSTSFLHLQMSCPRELLLWSLPIFTKKFSISLCPSTFINWNFILRESSLFSPP